MSSTDRSSRAPATRLAPSPTGALHLGNARTFLLTWALARKNGWRIASRIEDLDTPRVKPGAVEQAWDDLSWLGLDHDGWQPLAGPLQSRDLEPYRAAMRTLAERGLAYPCSLTRSEIAAAASAPQEGSGESRFPAELRPSSAGTPCVFDDEQTNWRLLVEPGPIEIDERFAGVRTVDPAWSVGDFILWTKRAQPSYQLACALDDARQSITDVVRGDDLVDSAGRQVLIARHLGIEPADRWWHLPLVLGTDGKRLAKRHGDTRLAEYRAEGVPAERVLGLLAEWSGLGPREPISAADFRDRLDLSTMPAEPVVLTPEDDAWLREGSS